MTKIPSVVVIGGGTGTFAVLSSLRDKPVSLTALMTMVDDGGSNRILRDEFGLLPTSGIRQALVALSQNQTLMRDLFTYRFHQGQGISGMTFGNLFLAAMSDILGSQKQAIAETAKLLDVDGTILPISYDDVRLLATYEDGSQIEGEHLISEPMHDGKMRITLLETKPASTISPESLAAIKNADFIIFGPGDLYTNTIANLVVGGVVDAIKLSLAKVIFVTNLMTKYGESYDYQASDFLTDLFQYLPFPSWDYIVINNDWDFPPDALAKYKEEFAIPVVDDLSTASLPASLQIVKAPLVSHDPVITQKGDTVKRSMIRHDVKKLGDVLSSIIFTGAKLSL